jgi:hypothetical protein
MRKFIGFSLLLVLVLLGMVIFTAAQDDDGPNYCTDGTWYCPDAERPWREDWNWACGWYLAHAEAGLIPEARVPEWCFIPTPVPPTSTPEPLPDQVAPSEAESTPGPS